jgi:DeoR/GlpR family transcriptional regulator of sugar metabolism
MTIDEGKKLLNVSESTVRRLFQELENKGRVIRTLGGIQSIQNNIFDYSFDNIEHKQEHEKIRIGEYASNFLNKGDIVFFDSGTTIYYLSISVVDRIRSNQLKDIIVFTNSLANLQILSPVCETILIGGKYRDKRRDFVGYTSEKMVKDYNYSKCFVGADGIDLVEGMMTTDINTARINELIVERSEKVIALIDAKKFCNRSFTSYTTLDKIDTIVTDSSLSQTYKEKYEQTGINMIYV